MFVSLSSFARVIYHIFMFIALGLAIWEHDMNFFLQVKVEGKRVRVEMGEPI